LTDRKVIAVACGQRSAFPRANALWFSDGRTFISDNDLGKMWEFRIEKVTAQVNSDIDKKIYTENDFIDVFMGHLSGRFAFTHRILDRQEADLLIKENELREIT